MVASLLLFALCWLPSLHPWCYAFVLFSSSAAASNVRLLELGSARGYHYTTTVQLSDAGLAGKIVGYQVTGQVAISVVWESGVSKLLQIDLTSPKLLIKPKKNADAEVFSVHKSQLEKFSNAPYLVLWKEGTVVSVHIDGKEDSSLKNLKKGIASLFQFQILDTRTQETDASGTCQVAYHTIDPYTILKTKTDCLAPKGVPFVRQPEFVLSTNITSSRSVVYSLSREQQWVDSIRSTEVHTMGVVLKQDAGSCVTSTQELISSDKSVKVKSLKSADLSSAVKEFDKAFRIQTTEEKLNSEVSRQSCSKDDCPSLPKLVKENREHLLDELLGTSKSATAFIKLLIAGRTATKDDLTKAFKGTKNKDIILQLCDLAGAIHTVDAHEVMKKVINFNSQEDADNVERYLWALAASSHPKVEIIKDLYKLSQRPSEATKLSETVLLTLASLSRKFRSIAGNEQHIIIEDVTNSITSNLEECKDEPCKHKNLRALRNLLCPKTIPILIQHALRGKTATSVEAMKTLRAFSPRLWGPDVIDAAQRIYFEAGRRYDSSARTLAIDILLECDPQQEVLTEMIASLLERDHVFEVKQYLAQRLIQMSQGSQVFAARVQSIMKELHAAFNNYDVQARRGLTTAFTRSFARSPLWNGSLVNIQEVSGGLLKRGIVDVVLSTQENATSLFKLGLFAGGLGGFVSSSNDKPRQDSNEEEVEEEVATAGMELSVMGSIIRPFVFFSGQGELMGHVWSGTASEKTPAYQAFFVTHDHLEHIVLQNGLVAQLQLLGAVSFDLSGQIQVSLWNRNAHSLVEQNAGVSLQGRIQVDNSFVKSQVEFSIATEVKLNLISDLKFYSGVQLCMQLIQPDAVLRHNIHKIERIIGSKHRLRVSKYNTIQLPGRTYVLNQKNNEMCSLMFQT